MLTPEIFPDHESMSAAAADWLERRVRARPGLLLCLATGATPMRSYELLAARPPALFAAARVLKLDEWGGIPMDSPATCETFLRRAIVNPLELEPRYFGFASSPPDPALECARVAEWLAAQGPIDACVLGLGLNGHLGFNEPAESLHPHAHIATLSPESMAHSMVADLPQKPTFGLTLGVADILQSREILLLVSGAAKAAPLKQLLAAEITPRFPGTFLWLHPRVSLLCDRAAAESL